MKDPSLDNKGSQHPKMLAQNGGDSLANKTNEKLPDSKLTGNTEKVQEFEELAAKYDGLEWEFWASEHQIIAEN